VKRQTKRKDAVHVLFRPLLTGHDMAVGEKGMQTQTHAGELRCSSTAVRQVPVPTTWAMDHGSIMGQLWRGDCKPSTLVLLASVMKRRHRGLSGESKQQAISMSQRELAQLQADTVSRELCHAQG
jgi:hypothetical protein